MREGKYLAHSRCSINASLLLTEELEVMWDHVLEHLISSLYFHKEEPAGLFSCHSAWSLHCNHGHSSVTVAADCTSPLKPTDGVLATTIGKSPGRPRLLAYFRVSTVFP